MKPEIIYENEEVLAVNKPAGLVVHSDGKNPPAGGGGKPTLADWVLKNYPEMKNIGERALYNGKEIARPGIVHRLDRETSGVIILAKTQESFLNLKRQFQNREIMKIYNTFVYGDLNPPAGGKSGVINLPIGRSKNDFRQWSAERGARGELREAITNYSIVKGNKDFTFVEVNPRTGRTHQIRVHFKAISHPVVCDKLYAPKRKCGLGFTRLALHARSLTFRLQSGETITVEADLTEDFIKALQEIAD